MLEERQNYYFEADEFIEITAYYLDVGDLAYAKKAIVYAEEMYPGSTEIQIKKLEYLLAVNKLKEASQLILNLKSVGENDLDYLICVGRFWSLKENPAMSISFYEKALEFGEDLEYIYNCLGNEYLNLNEIQQALNCYKNALELDPEDDFAFYSCIQCFEELHQNQKCISFIEEYIEERPYSDMAWTQLGEQFMMKKDYEQAHRAFDYASLINPKSILAYTQKAACLEKLEDYYEAIEVYKETLDFDDSAGYTYLKIGNCYEKLGSTFKALKAYHQAIHEDPQLAKAWASASDIYEQLGSYDEGLYYLNRALELDNENPEFWKRRAYLYIRLVKLEEASLDYYKLCKLEPGNFYNWLGLVEVLITLGDYQKGIEAVNLALKHFDRAELYYQISNCYYLLGNETMGKKMFAKASQMNDSLQSEMFKKYPILENHFLRSGKKSIGKKSK